MSRRWLSCLLVAVPMALTACAGFGDRAVVRAGGGVGVGGGGDQNYQILEPRKTRYFPTEPDPMTTPRTVNTTRPAATSPPGATAAQETQPAKASTAPGAGQRMPRRRHWTPIVFRPADGRTAHGPLYFADAAKASDQNILTIESTTGQLDAVLTGAQDHLFSPGNRRKAVIEPLGFFFDVGILPVHLIQQPPWTWTTTPPTPSTPPTTPPPSTPP